LGLVKKKSGKTTTSPNNAAHIFPGLRPCRKKKGDVTPFEGAL